MAWPSPSGPLGWPRSPGSTARRRRVPRSGMRSTVEAGASPDNARQGGCGEEVPALLPWFRVATGVWPGWDPVWPAIWPGGRSGCLEACPPAGSWSSRAPTGAAGPICLACARGLDSQVGGQRVRAIPQPQQRDGNDNRSHFIWGWSRCVKMRSRCGLGRPGACCRVRDRVCAAMRDGDSGSGLPVTPALLGMRTRIVARRWGRDLRVAECCLEHAGQYSGPGARRP